MPTNDEPAASRVSANNRGDGSQYILDGQGDQHNINENGVMWKVGEQYNYYSSPPQLLQKPKARSPEGITHDEIILWLGEQSAQATKETRQYQSILRKQIAHRTGKWIVDKEELRAWKDTSNLSRALCCMYGKLGSGKTMLVSFIIDHIEKEIKNVDGNICLFFYFQEGEKHYASRMWKALLMQLLERTCIGLTGELKQAFNDLRQRSTEIEIDSADCLGLFKAQVEAFKVIYLIIDSVDHCDDAPGQMTQKVLRETLETFPPKVRVLFTSRGDLIGHGDERYQKLFIEPNQHDVESYVEKRITDDANLSKLLAKSEKRRQVINGVTATTMTHKMFLLARLHMDNLKEKKTVREILAALETLPDSPSKAVDSIVQKIRREEPRTYDSHLAEHTLTWVMREKEKLTLAQIQDSFAVRQNKFQTYKDDRPEKDSLLRACNGLIKIDQEKTFGLVHRLFQTQLEKNLIPKNADTDIAKTCLYYLLADTHDNESEPPLLRYAATYWYEHLGSDQAKVDSEAKELVLRFLTDSTKLTRAFKSMGDLGGGTFDEMTGLHAAVHYNLLSWAEHYLKSGKHVDINATCSDGQTALHWAVRYNRLELVELFIQESANPNIQDTNGETPILSSIRYGYTRLGIRMIENQQNNIDTEISPGWTLLRHILRDNQAASVTGKKGDFKYKEKKGIQTQHTPNNHTRILTDLLFDLGANLNLALGKDGWTPLVYAIQTGNLSQMHRLLTREPHPADVHLRNSKGKTPLWWAVSHKKIAAVQLLIEHGANINELYDDGSTPLFKAIKQKSGTIAQLLIELGADVNITALDKSTPLTEAIRSEDYATCLMLINAGAQLNEKDAQSESPLIYAIENNNKTLAALLLQKEAAATRPHKRTSNGIVSIQVIQGFVEKAVKRNDFSMAWLLCNYGASLDYTNKHAQTFLHIAAIAGDLPRVRFLVAQGAAINTRDKHGFTPLHFAVYHHLDDIVAPLAPQASQSPRDSRESQLDVVDNKRSRAHALAVHDERLAVIQTLISGGASCNIQDGNGMTALHLAAQLGFREGVQLLLRGGADPNMRDRKGCTPIYQAIASRNAELVRLLVEEGTNLNVYDADQRAPWMLAAQLDNQPLAHYLRDIHEAADHMY